MKNNTLAIKAGRKNRENKNMVNTPVYRTSTVLFENLKSYHEAESKRLDYSYGTTGTETAFALQDAITQIEGGYGTIVTPSGLSAITTTLLAFLKAGDHLLVTDSIYGATRRFCDKMLINFGVEVEYYDPFIGGDIKSLIKDNTKMVFTESPGSLTFEIQDIPAIVKAAHDKQVLVAIDNTWATPFYFDSFSFGVDISIQAGTKFISGHSDILIGSVCAKNEELFLKLYDAFHFMGNCSSPDDCYLALRGLRTMPLRMKQHEETSLKIINWLQDKKKVKEILHPSIETHKNHDIWKRDFKGSVGLFTIILDKKYSYESVCNMVDNMQIFGIGASWGGYESLIMHFSPKSIRTATKWQHEETCLRLYIGLEDYEDIIEDLQSAFLRLS